MDKSLTSQQVFDTVVNHLRSQGKRSTDEQGHCRYRSADGSKCAAGILLYDEEYKPIMEGQSIIGILDQASVPLHNRLFPHQALIFDLQSAHDLKNVSEWEQKFKVIAMKYSLTYSQL